MYLNSQGNGSFSQSLHGSDLDGSLSQRGGWERVDQRIGSTPPCQRSLHAAVCWKDNMLVFGGYDGHQRLNDLHCYNFTSSKWGVLSSVHAPSPRDRHSAVVYENYLVIFGGFDGVTRVDDLHIFDLENMSWRAIEDFSGTPPSARHSHNAVRWRDMLYIFGGYDGGYKNDLYEFNFLTRTWRQVVSVGEVPRARYRGTCVVHENTMVLHGGHDGSRHLQDTYIFDFLTKTWTLLETTGTIPSARDSHIAVVFNKSMFIYGGSTGVAMGDFHELSLTDKVWAQMELSPRSSPSHSSKPTRSTSVLTSTTMESTSESNTQQASNAHHQFGFSMTNNSSTGRIPLSGLATAFSPSTVSTSRSSSLVAMANRNHLLLQTSTSHSSATASSAVLMLNPSAATAETTVSSVVAESVIEDVSQHHTSQHQQSQLFHAIQPTGSQMPMHTTSTFYFNDHLHQAPMHNATNNLTSPTTPAHVGHRFCHVGIVYDESLYVFGGYDGTHRLNDFVRFRFTAPEDQGPPSTLLSDLKALVDNELLYDVSFIVEGIPIRAHKVLCLRCPYFRNLLTGEYMESRSNEIVIPEVRHSVFLQFLEFVYTDRTDIDFDCAMELFQAADRFGAERLKKACERYILDVLSIETAGQIMLIADSHHATHLRDRCMTFIITHFDEVSKTSGFEEMARCDVELLLEILRKR